MSSEIPLHTIWYYSTSGQILAGCLAVTIWDTLCHFLDDFQILFFQKFSWTTVVFIVARASPIVYFIALTMFTASIDVNCGVLQIMYRVLLVLARTSTAFLLLLRVNAIYTNKKPARIFFSMLWFMTLGVFLLLAIDGIKIDHPSYYWCSSFVQEIFIAPAVLVEMLSDTLMCLAILYELGGTSWKERGRLLMKLFRPHHPYLTDIVLQDTLIYACLAVLSNLALIFGTVLFGSGFSENITVAASHPSAVAINLISLRVHRNMKLGTPGLVAPATPSAPNQISHLVFNSTHTDGTQVNNSTGASNTEEAENEEK
ncbi:hypothetical protein CPB83DRAFT_541873 [Crepidotus variabilis]|uniref:Uncharacterized protein n=1 Tax=Crepidotus variabilis TaxID=179855 RepID=A0A9P6JUT5_9AGAR|nr:hypothetical protein CPB83DRAFT_541873 [Crepidotus variabilis]